MSRVYVAAPLPLRAEARELALALRKRRCDVTSTWHETEATIANETAMSEGQLAGVAAQCLAEVGSSEALVLLHGPATERHGSIGEAFFALGRALDVHVVAVCPDAAWPTILLYGHPCVSRWPSVSALLEGLR